MTKETISVSGVGFCNLLFLLFLGLKLGNVIDWSWWWVFAPLWLPVVLFLVGIGIVFLWLAISSKKGKE